MTKYLCVTNLMKYVGLKANMKGYEYVRDIILLLSERDELRHHLTEGVYPIIADKYKVSVASVERSIRHSIERAFDICAPEILYGVFGNSIDPNKGKATNSEFLLVLFDLFKIAYK